MNKEQTMEKRFDYKMDEIMRAWEKQEYVYDLRQGLKDFINSEIDLALKSQQERLVGEIMKILEEK